MTELQIKRVARIHTTHGQATAARGAGGRGRRAALRLWTLLHAQAILDGTAGGAGYVTFVEDDRQRLAGRRAR
jgi:hypothetical protein